jgi:hypothetical protein
MDRRRARTVRLGAACTFALLLFPAILPAASDGRPRQGRAAGAAATAAASTAGNGARAAAADPFAARPLLQSGPPEITTVIPLMSWPTAGGIQIKILGENFGPSGGEVTIGGQVAPIVYYSETEIVVTLLAGSGADLPLVVRVGVEYSNTVAVNYEAPRINSVSPSQGWTTQAVKIRGEDFAGNAAQDHVFFGENEAKILTDSYNQIEVTPPSGSGSVQVYVITSGQVSRNTQSFTYVAPACVPGYYSETGDVPCEPAPAGSYVATTGATSATLCSAGTYQPERGQLECVPAPQGKYVATEGATQATSCSLGTFTAAVRSTACELAAPGSYVATTGATSATLCSAGTYQPERGQLECVSASPGRYVATEGATQATLCAVGTFSAATGAIACEPAPAGSYVPTEGATQATLCVAGTFSVATGSIACVPAEPGHFVASTGQDSQSPCASGSYQPSSGQTECLEAQVGYYVNTAGSSSQTQCPAGTTTASTGSTSESDCMPIPKAVCTTNTGTITISPGLTNVAKVQTVKVKGTLSGCTGEAFTTVKYTATLKTGAVSCSVLKGAGEPASGAVSYAWTPKAKASKGTLGLPLSESAGVELTGTLTSGSYAPLTLEGTARESYTDGPDCGSKVGKKTVKVTKGTVSGSTVGFF